MKIKFKTYKDYWKKTWPVWPLIVAGILAGLSYLVFGSAWVPDGSVSDATWRYFVFILPPILLFLAFGIQIEK